MFSEKPLLILMDGHALVHRAWHAIRKPLNVSSTGEEVRAVYGFLNTFLRTLADERPTHCAIAFDLPTPTFRHERFKEYKAHRPSTPPELRPQFDHIRELMRAFGVPIYEQERYEADDVLGTLCRQAEQQEMETLVLTGDTDTLQLVSARVRVKLTYSVQKTNVYDVAGVQKRYGGLGPEVVPDIKALEGDTSDNIPGVPGVGAKTAIRLLLDYGSVEGIYEHIDEVKPPGAQKNLRANQEAAIEGKFLATIKRDVPVELDLEQTLFWRYDRKAIVDILTRFEFFSIVPRVPDPLNADGAAEEQGQLSFEDTDARQTDYTVVDSEEGLDSLVTELSQNGGFAFSTVGTNPIAMSADLVGLSFSNAADRAWYVPLGHAAGTQLPMEPTLTSLRGLFASPEIPKVAHEANYHVTLLAKHGLDVNNLAFDTTLAAHIGGRKSLGLKALALECVHIEQPPITDLTGTGRKRIPIQEASIEQTVEFAAADADVTGQVHAVLQKEIVDKGVKDAFDSVEMPLVPILVRMQVNGVALDTEQLNRLSDELGDQMARIETEMFEVVGHKYNLNSSQQLGEVLFKELGLPPTKRTKTGYSTDASALEGLKHVIDQGESDDVDPKALQVLDNILEYRQVSKIKSTYAGALPALVNPETGRIHTSYNQTGSATGRVSSNDPNVQNIPVRTELGNRVRKAFIAQRSPEWLLLGADYSQIELRITAHMSQDPGLIEAFDSGQDVHASTASQVCDVSLDEVTADMRRIAKIMNFGVIYGLSAFGISQQTGLSPDEGKSFIETYFGKYPGIRDYVDSTKDKVRRLGYVETLIGRRRYIPEIMSRSFHVRAAGERMAINMPVQGTAADIIKIAMVRLQGRIDAAGLDSLMILQVHDELIFEVRADELEEMEAIVLDVMPSAMDLTVPLEVDLKTGPNWGEMG